MAIWIEQFQSCWTTGRPLAQCVDSRPLWMPANDDVFHGLDDSGNIYSLLRTILTGSGLR